MRLTHSKQSGMNRINLPTKTSSVFDFIFGLSTLRLFFELLRSSWKWPDMLISPYPHVLCFFLSFISISCSCDIFQVFFPTKRLLIRSWKFYSVVESIQEGGSIRELLHDVHTLTHTLLCMCVCMTCIVCMRVCTSCRRTSISVFVPLTLANTVR